VIQVEDGDGGRGRDGWRMCGDDAMALHGWAAETGRTVDVTFHSDDERQPQSSSRPDRAQPDIGAWIRFTRESTRRYSINESGFGHAESGFSKKCILLTSLNHDSDLVRPA